MRASPVCVAFRASEAILHLIDSSKATCGPFQRPVKKDHWYQRRDCGYCGRDEGGSPS